MASIKYEFKDLKFTAVLDDAESSANIRSSDLTFKVSSVWIGGLNQRQFAVPDVDVNDNSETVYNEEVTMDRGPLGELHVHFTPPVDLVHFKLSFQLVETSSLAAQAGVVVKKTPIHPLDL